MACLTAGRNKQCSTGISGGLKAIYVADKADVASLTGGAGAAITAITMNGAGVFYKYEFKRDTAFFNEELTNENCSTQVTQQVGMSWTGSTQADISTIMELANCCCGMVVIVEYSNGVKKLSGFDENEEYLLETTNINSGSAKSDAFEAIITLATTATRLADTFTAAIPV